MSDSGSTQTIEPSTAERRTTGRSIGVVVCVVLAVLLTTPAVVAFWGQRTLNDAQRYLDTVGPLVNSPEVQDAIATTVTNAIEQQVDIEAVLNEVFAGVITDRPRLQKLVGPLSGAINGLIDREVRAFVASDAFADIWVRVNTRAQQALVRLLKGEEETGAVSLQGDQVVLDVSDVIDQVKQRLVARGLTIVENVPVPEVDRQIVLLEAPQLEQARTIYAFANPVARWLILVVAALYLAAFLLSRRRPRMTVIIGVALVANALLLAWSLSIGSQLFINELVEQEPAGAGALGSALGHAGCVLGSPALGRRSALRPAPTRTCTTARSTTTSSSDQTSRDTETSLPHSRTTTPSTPTATRSHRAFAATQRPAPPSDPSASFAPTDSRPPDSVVRTAVPEALDPVNQPTTTRISPSHPSTCQPRSR
jgi:hypothetical protein